MAMERVTSIGAHLAGGTNRDPPSHGPIYIYVPAFRSTHLLFPPPTHKTPPINTSTSLNRYTKAYKMNIFARYRAWKEQRKIKQQEKAARKTEAKARKAAEKTAGQRGLEIVSRNIGQNRVMC
jgi:hypothetical protein